MTHLAALSLGLSPAISLVDGQLTTTSLDIAKHFNKRHDTVLRAVRQLECSPEFTARNFAASEYVDSTGRKLTQYRITRDGFCFLCMGFTGKEAAKWKEAYINAFNTMENILANRQKSPSHMSITELLGRELGLTERVMLFRRHDTGDYYCRPITNDQCVMTPEQFLRAVTTPMDLLVPSELLFEFVQRATALLAGRQKALAQQVNSYRGAMTGSKLLAAR